MQFDRLDPAELVSLILAALAGGSLYAIVVTSPPLPQGKQNVVPPGPSAAAEISPTVKIIGPFPADSHPAIVYPVAATLTAKPEAVDYLAFLRSITTKAIFEQYGFTFLIQPTS